MGYKRLRIFDFDDTLVKTESFVYVENNNKINKLSPGEFAIYEEKPGDKFDFKEFEDVKNSLLAKNKRNYFILESSKNDNLLEKKILKITSRYLNIR